MPPPRNSITDQSLDQLEQTHWPAPKTDTYVTSNVYRLRQIPLNQFRIEDLRLMIGQQVGTRFLVPLAFDHLERDPFAEGDFYPGDLLIAVIELPIVFWEAHRELIPRVISLMDAANAKIAKLDPSDDLADRVNRARDRLAKLTGTATD